jgi:hypothetical protein
MPALYRERVHGTQEEPSSDLRGGWMASEDVGEPGPYVFLVRTALRLKGE